MNDLAVLLALLVPLAASVAVVVIFKTMVDLTLDE
jgi:hypothetical protein